MDNYYAPFYQPNYYSNPAQNRQYPQQYQQQYIQQGNQINTAQMYGQQTNDFLWVLNENEAISYPVAPNGTVTMWDKNLPTIYIKSVNAQGVPSMRILDFTERTSTSPTQPQNSANNPIGNFVTLDRFNALETELQGIKTKIEEMQVKTAEV